MPVNNPANQLVLTEDGTSVRHVMVDGRLVIRDRQHVGTDMRAMAARVGAARDRLAELNAPARVTAAAFEDVVGTFCIGLSRQHHHIDRYGAAHQH
jgi:guanine deaminase